MKRRRIGKLLVLFAIVGSSSGAEVAMLVRAATALCCLLSGLAYLLPGPANHAPAKPAAALADDDAPGDSSPSS